MIVSWFVALLACSFAAFLLLRPDGIPAEKFTLRFVNGIHAVDCFDIDVQCGPDAADHSTEFDAEVVFLHGWPHCC